MIHNEQQLERNKYWIERFSESVRELTNASLEKDVHPTLYKAQIDGMQYLIKDLQKEIDDYEVKKKYVSNQIDEALEQMRIERVLSHNRCKGCGCRIAEGNEYCAECLCEDDTAID